jgi:uncharacterized protein
MVAAAKPKPSPTFLTARWSNLALLSYAVPDETLNDLTPPGCELDRLDGRAFVSLVAFDFTETAVAGVRWPGFRVFPEINLRFYVRQDRQRGVCFVREFVPCGFIALMAKVFYNEPYRGVPMTSEITETPQSIDVRHRLEIDGRQLSLSIRGDKPSVMPEDDSVEAFFKEHEYGYGISRRRRLIRYRVEHPKWNVFPVSSYKLDWDWPAAYGERWSFLQDRQPDHVLLAAGSRVRVMRQQ